MFEGRKQLEKGCGCWAYSIQSICGKNSQYCKRCKAKLQQLDEFERVLDKKIDFHEKKLADGIWHRESDHILWHGRLLSLRELKKTLQEGEKE